MSRDLVELMDKKNQTSHRQSNQPVAKDSNPNKFVNDWKRESYNGRYQGNDKKNVQSRFVVGIDDKRFRHRGYYSKYQKEEMKRSSTMFLDSEEPEEMNALADVVDKRGRKSKSLNHMVNFYNKKEGNASHVESKFKHRKFIRGSNKERFLQANCQFVVKPDMDYKHYFIDPDLLIDWDLILQVRLFVHEYPSCPICLYPPRASKITKCGHVYCWPCMLHYLSLSAENDTWSKCPICCEPVHEKDLKSVSITEVARYKPGAKIKMRLMSKIKGDTVVNPRILWQKGLNTVKSVRDNEKSVYAKLLTADNDYVNGMADTEMTELSEMLSETDPNTLEGSFIVSAIEKNKIMAECTSQDFHTKSISCNIASTLEIPNKDVPKRVAIGNAKSYSSAFDEAVSNEVASNENATNQAAECSSESPSSIDEIGSSLHNMSLADGPVQTPKDDPIEKLKFFYQAADGQHIYMHSLNVRCLISEYSSLEQCPDEIDAIIVDIEEFSMSEGRLPQFTYLNHLPSSCQFRIVELDLCPPLVSKTSLQIVEDLIRKRKRDREVRERRDKRNAIKIQKIENKLMGYDPDSKIVGSDYHKIQEEGVFQDCFNGSYHFPEIQSSVFEKSSDQPGASCEVGERKVDGDHPGLSFAQMLRSGKAKPCVKPKSSLSAASKEHDQEDGIGEVPDFSVSWNADLKKLDEALLNIKQDGKANPQSGKRKNKKGILLFATGGPHCK